MARTKTILEGNELTSIRLLREAFQAIEDAVWHDRDLGAIKGPNRLMATALIKHVWKQLDEDKK